MCLSRYLHVVSNPLQQPIGESAFPPASTGVRPGPYIQSRPTQEQFLWTAKVTFPVEPLSIRPVHEKAIFHQLIRRTGNFWIADDSPSISLEVGNRLYQPIQPARLAWQLSVTLRRDWCHCSGYDI